MGGRVIFVNRYCYPDHSATSQLLTDLSEALATAGREVHVVASRQRYQDPRARVAPVQQHAGVAIHRTWSTRFGRRRMVGRLLDYASFMVTACAWLFANVRRGDILVLMTDPPMLALLASWATAFRGARLVNWIQDLFPETAQVLGPRAIAPLAPPLRGLRDRLLARAYANVVIGERMLEMLRARCGGARFHLIHNWAPGEAIEPIARDLNSLRYEWGLSEAFVVGYSGNMGRAHEFQTVLDAAGLVRNPIVRFLFIGAGSQRDAVEEIVRARNMVNILFQPYQPIERLSESLGVADVHLVSLNPRLEGCIVPSKFYGVAAAGRPTLFVGANQGEIGSLIDHHRCGASVAEGDAQRMSQLIDAWAADRSQAGAMGERARALYEREFSLQRAVSQWQQAIAVVATDSAR